MSIFAFSSNLHRFRRKKSWQRFENSNHAMKFRDFFKIFCFMKQKKRIFSWNCYFWRHVHFRRVQFVHIHRFFSIFVSFVRWRPFISIQQSQICVVSSSLFSSWNSFQFVIIDSFINRFFFDEFSWAQFPRCRRRSTSYNWITFHICHAKQIIRRRSNSNFRFRIRLCNNWRIVWSTIRWFIIFVRI